tara:strand:- start:4801 stop:5532 length:732 start_codon:yes stop_codon:yes gene_type:complete
MFTSLLLSINQATAASLLIAVAANFTAASREIATRFEADTGHSVNISYGSTGKLFSQIEHGAPFEVFLGADSLIPEKAIDAGLALSDSRFSYARGKLVLWSIQPQLFDNPEKLLLQAAFKRAAIANPRTSPYGLAAQQALQHLDIWEMLKPQLAVGDSIAQTFQFIATGNATLGFVALAQIKAWKGEPGSLWLVPESYYQPIDQQAVLLNRGQHNPVAHEFLEFLKGPEARRIISAYGYNLPL